MVTHTIVVVVVVVVEKESDSVIVGPDIEPLWVYHWVVKLDQLCIIKC